MERRNPLCTPPKKTRTCGLYRPDLPSEFPNLLFTSHLRPDIKSRAEIVDGMSGKAKCVTPTCVGAGKGILSEALESRFAPRSRFRSCLV